MLFVVKLKVAQLKNGSHHSPYLFLLLFAESDLVHRFVYFLEVFGIIDVVSSVAATLVKILISLRFFDSVGFWGSEGVEGMVGSFVGSYWNYSALFQQVTDDVGALNGEVLSEEDLNVLTEATGVIVSDGFAVSEGLQQRVTRQYLILDWVAFAVTEVGQHLHAVLGRFCFSGSRLPRDDDRLFSLSAGESLVCFAGDHEYVGSLLHVSSHDFVSQVAYYFVVEVFFNDFVWIDDYEGGSDISKDVIISVAIDDVPQNFRFVENVHFAHVRVQLSFWHFEGVLIFGSDW